MKREWLIAIMIVSSSVVLAGSIYVHDVYAQSIVPCSGAKCMACSFVTLAQNVINFLVGAAVFIAVLMFAWAGFMMMFAAGDPGRIAQAKSIFGAVFVGIIITLAAWLIVDLVLKALMGQGFSSPLTQIECIPQTELAKKSTNLPGGVTGSGPGGSTSSGSGQCQPQSSGGCNASKFSGFGVAATQASGICMAESGGNPAQLSGTDKTRDGKSFSVGLFQINLSVHKLHGCGPGGGDINCPAAFSGRDYRSTVTNKTLYDTCVRAASNESCNISNALRIYKAAGSRWTPWGANSKCKY